MKRFGDAGFPLVQFRGKPLEADAQWTELRKALEESRASGGWPWICLNDRADLAVLAAQEGLTPWGLHLGQEDLPPEEARRLPGLADCHLGTSTHHPAEWDDPPSACDHAGVGPVRATRTKADHAQPLGLEGLRLGCTSLRARVLAPVAIGGLELADAGACYQAGAESLAMVGAVHASADPAALGWEAQRLRWRVRPPVQAGGGIVILGGSGAGKSALGRALAFRLGRPFHDLDAVIEAQEGCSIPELFAVRGEPAFRALERSLLPTLLDRPAVVALGGGAWESPDIRRAVAGAGWSPLWLAETPERAWARVQGDPGRPLVQDREGFMRRWAARTPAWSLAPMALPFGHTSRELAEALLD